MDPFGPMGGLGGGMGGLGGGMGGGMGVVGSKRYDMGVTQILSWERDENLFFVGSYDESSLLFIYLFFSFLFFSFLFFSLLFSFLFPFLSFPFPSFPLLPFPHLLSPPIKSHSLRQTHGKKARCTNLCRRGSMENQASSSRFESFVGCWDA